MYTKGLIDTSSIYNYLTYRDYASMLRKIGIYRLGEKATNKNFIEKFFVTLFCNTHINFCNILFSHFTDKNTD